MAIVTISGFKSHPEYPIAETILPQLGSPPNTADLNKFEEIIDAQQILDDGFFHADPHPGNLQIQGGRIMYLDFGIVGRLSAHDRGAGRGG